MPKRARGAAGPEEQESTANEVTRIVEVCNSVDPRPRLALLARILGEKLPLKVARARRRAETRDSFLGGSLHEQSGRSWPYLEMTMDSHYVGRRLCTRIGPRTCEEARDSEKRKFALYNYKPALE